MTNASDLWIPVLFLALAVWFFSESGSPVPPSPPPAVVAREDIAASTLRRPIGDPPAIEIGGFRQICSDCHRLFDSRPETGADLHQHESITLDHGLNDRCLNCHSLRDRDKLVLNGGKEIGFADTVLLCAQCHGPTYRDWQKGTHGKTMGSWDVGKGRRLRCVECHDPHAPAFDRMRPLPGPNTLCMGLQPPPPAERDFEDESPLLRWLPSASTSQDSFGRKEE